MHGKVFHDSPVIKEMFEDRKIIVGAISPQPKTQPGGSRFVWYLSFNLPEVQDSS